MSAVNIPITIEQGTDWAHGWAVIFNGAPIDETWTAHSQIRQTSASTVPHHTFASDVTVEGAVVLAVSPAESSAWAWRSGVYDVEIVNADGSVTLRVAQGNVTVSAEVTR